MDEEFKNLLKKNIEISEESFKILKSIRRSNRIGFIFKIFYWFVILGGIAGSYYYLQPLIKNAISSFGQITDITSGAQGLKGQNGQNIPDLLKSILGNQ